MSASLSLYGTNLTVINSFDTKYSCSKNCSQGQVSRKFRKLSGFEKPFVKLRLAYSVKLVFSYVVKRIKIQITSKFRASRRLCFKDTKRIMSPEMRPKSFGTFEKRAPVPDCPKAS